MANIIFIIGTNLLITLAIYLLIAFVLININKNVKDSKNQQNNLSFNELVIDYTGLPEYLSYKCRDKKSLNYRLYSSQSDKVLILVHGSGWHSDYFLPLARYISSENVANVYTPDLRGHGISPNRRGDINYINQLEDDLADFIFMVKKKHPSSTIIVGGHSSGGGLVTRLAGSKYKNEADAYILLSPYLKYNAPITKMNSGGWAVPHTPRIIGLSMLNNIGISLLNNLSIIDFVLPEEYRNGTETLSYSYRLNTGYAPRNYKKDLNLIDQELLILVGTSDEVLYADKFKAEISKYNKKASIRLIENVTHMGIVVGNEVQPIIRKWMSTLN